MATALMALGLLALVPAVAQAGVFAGGGITFPTTATVGDKGLPGSIGMTNNNTAPNTGDTNTVCNAADPSPPCGVPEQGIVLVPSCKQVAAGQCTAAGAEPGVFAVSALAFGRAGTACAGIRFDTAIADPTFGSVRFTPEPAGAHVTLPGAGASCVIDFTFDVIKSPTTDADPGTPGVQTEQQAANTQFSGVLNNEARGTSIGTTIVRAVPSILTTAPATAALGGQLTDTATVNGLISPLPGATIDFRLYGPVDTACLGTPIFHSTVPYPVTGGPVTSGGFTAPDLGTYRWIAAYSGDADNTPVTGTCNEATETTTVTPPPPPPKIALTKVASPLTKLAPGGDFTFTATVSNPSTTTPVTITKLVDNIYGDLATRPGSTCNTLIGVTLAPRAKSAPCAFTGAFTGQAGDSQTDVITVTGVNGSRTVTATASATVVLTPPGGVSALTLRGFPSCVSTPFKVSLSGPHIARVTWYIEGKRIATVTRHDSAGRFVFTINPKGLSRTRFHHLLVVAQPVPHSGQPVRTVRRTFAVCAKLTLPRFTG
ncbi:MAG: hypothetical protein QOF77_2377 [Solirubrobacteraceae bacterium]|nr:hypothetical protein [Solirubrobacteraceae bacterium]